MCFYPRVCAKVLYNLMVRLGGVCSNYLVYVCRYNQPQSKTMDDCSSNCSSSSSNNSSKKENIELNDNVYDYVVINETNNQPAGSPKKKIETEPYYRTINRLLAEDTLIGRDDGACLVRPFKESDISIQYIVSIYAKDNFFHLYLRKLNGIEKYAIGLQKPSEKLFDSPSDIIKYYSNHELLCTNKQVMLSLTLVPIT